jgi:anthranilate/para-aminobenzoate synthase component I
VAVRELTIPPDVLVLAGRLSDRPGVAVLASGGSQVGALAGEDGRFSFVACDPVEVSEAWIPETERWGRGHGWGGAPAAPRWIGAIPYEAGRGLERPGWRPPETRPEPPLVRPRWQRYDAVARVDAWTGKVAIEADSEAAAARLAGLLRRDADEDVDATSAVRAPAPVELRLEPDAEPDLAHVARVREILRLIGEGDVYQVNLARCVAMQALGRPLDVFTALFKGAPAPYGFFADFGGLSVCGTSPELALEVRGELLRTAPIKGTRPRGRDAAGDRELARELDADAKERAELTMAIDLHRNDLGKIAVPGSVRVRGAPRVVAGRTVWSRVAEIVARRMPGTSLDAITRAMVPCGSVTGAPKIRAMEIIATLEPFRRGLYTGTYGYVGRDGGLVLAMAIRTLEISAGGRARYCTGGGIVHGSDPWRELEETRWKASHVLGLVHDTTPKAVRNLAETGRWA